jgi:nicotinamidase-related amidase
VLRFGPLTNRTMHLCIDMQNIFAEDTPWHTPWVARVLPIVAGIARRQAERTIFTRFIPPRRAEDAPGVWRRYFDRWRDLTGDHVDPRLLELVPPLAAMVPPAMTIDKPVYSPFATPRLLGLLQHRGADSLVITGAETDVCVLAAVMDAVDHGFRVVLAADAICGSSDRTHEALMTLYSQRFSEQIEVADSETIMSCWR